MRHARQSRLRCGGQHSIRTSRVPTSTTPRAAALGYTSASPATTSTSSHQRQRAVRPYSSTAVSGSRNARGLPVGRSSYCQTYQPPRTVARKAAKRDGYSRSTSKKVNVAATSPSTGGSSLLAVSGLANVSSPRNSSTKPGGAWLAK